MRAALLTLIILLGAAGTSLAEGEKPMLLQSPTLSRTHVVFVYAGDLWAVGREGGDARRLTAGTGVEADPLFSPDGRTVAFTGEYDGNTDVYTVPAEGGVPVRLTYHPGADRVVDWTPDGERVLFVSGRNSYSVFARLFTIPAAGGVEAEVPLPQGFEASYSPDGSRLAYVPVSRAFTVWKRYRGGRTTPIWLANLADSGVERVPRENSNDFNPMWVGPRVYFLSDRGGPVSLYAYDTATKKVARAVSNTGLDIKSASAGPGAIVYEQFGSLHLLDIDSGKTTRLDVRVTGDMPGVRPRYERVGGRVSVSGLSPSGARAVFEARGEILSVPAEKGDVRNLTNTPGAAERDPAWSPDGRRVAYFSDESGEYALHLREQSGMGDVRKINLGTPPSYFYSPVWSPDGQKIAYTDKRLNLWYVDVERAGAAPVRVDTNTYDNPYRLLDPAWSPDSRHIAYTKQLRNRLAAVFVHSLEEARSRQVTDGMSDARYAVFDKNGKHLYFTASTNAGPTTGWLDMSSYPHTVTRSVYVVVLSKDEPSPLAPESDEEKTEEPKKEDAAPAPSASPSAPTPDAAAAQPGMQTSPPAQAAAKAPPAKKPAPVRIDFDGIDQRILALPLPARGYAGMAAGKTGTLFLLESPAAPGPDATGLTLHRFDLSKRKAEKVLDGVNSFDLAANGEKMLVRQGPRWFIASSVQPLKPGEGTIDTASMETYVDPRAEWRQMYRETWRIQRDFFYDPNLHGLDLKAAEQRYEVFLDQIAHRADLNYLFAEMIGNLSIGHHNVAGGDMPEPRRVQGGLLGADYRIENGRYRFARVYGGENWNPSLRAPLTQPGVNVREGEYLLSAGGREVRATENVHKFFEATANRAVLIKVGPNPDGAGAREVTVVPVASEQGLRHLAWIESNRRKVDEMSGGRVAYVYLPNTGGSGYSNFNRYYFAQIHKEGAVIDDRFNGGGSAADYMIDYMRRPLMNYWTTREGEDFTTPVGAIFGPKAMIINENSSSGGDALPWYFRKAAIGPLVGKRTWGGLVGIYDYPPLIDGGYISAPRVAFRNAEGDFDVENKGVAPDIEVELDPQAWRAGRDLQLEKAVEVVVEALKKSPLPKPRKPAYPNYQKAAR